MSKRSETTLTPRNGKTLQVLVVARISGCADQKDISLQDQEEHAKEAVAELYEGDVEYKTIATRGKGEQLDRPELEQIETLLCSRQYDLFVLDDLGRLVRGTDAVRILGKGVDHGTRTIAVNDCIDTADETWEEDAIAACRDHVGHNAHTSKRLKQKMMRRFEQKGECVANQIYGYIKPKGAKNYDDWTIDRDATPFIQEGARLLIESGNCSAVADHFNEKGVPVGPHCRVPRWNGAMIRRFYKNPILKGFVGRGFLHTVKHHGTGKRVCVKNPKGPKWREVPHLAHLTPEVFDQVNHRLQEKNKCYRRKRKNGEDPCSNRHRRDSNFPGQHAICAYCGRKYVWGGNGQTDHLMCNGPREWHCWNAISFDGIKARKQICDLIAEHITGLTGFAEQFQQILAEATQKVSGNAEQLRTEIERDQRELDRKKENLNSAILEYGAGDFVRSAKQRCDELEYELRQKRSRLARLQQETPQLPATIPELQQLFRESLAEAAEDSLEMTILLRKLVPKFEVIAMRLCDGGHVVAGARLTLALDGFVPDAELVPGLGSILTREVTINLSEPPQRERIRVEAVALAQQGYNSEQIARMIAERPSSTAVQRALKLQRRMEELGLDSPYVVLDAPPEDYTKLRRHKNRRYRFLPVDPDPSQED